MPAENVPVPTEEITAFVQGIILPAIDAFNEPLGRTRAKEKVRHPHELKMKEPGLDALWSIVGVLRGRMAKDQSVPYGLLDKVVTFAEQFNAHYIPINEFLNNFNQIAEREAKALKRKVSIKPLSTCDSDFAEVLVELRLFEFKPTVKAFKAVLDARKPKKSPWSEGWPLLKFPR